MSINQHLWDIVLIYNQYKRKILPIIFHTIQLTKHPVDWVSADYVDYYIQGSCKSDKYGFSLLPA